MENIFKFVADTKVLTSILGSLLTIIEKTVTDPIFNNIKLEVKANILSIIATDRDISACYKMYVKGDQDGSTTVNGRLFYDIMRKINDEQVNLFYSETQQFCINVENCKFALSTLPSEKFHSIIFYEEQISFSILASNLVKILNDTIFSISNEESRYNLNGVYLNVNNSGILTAVATDCHRLALANSNIRLNNNFGIIIPKKTVEEIIKLFKNVFNEQISIKLNSRIIEFSSKMITLTSKLIDGKFPEYNEFIPYDNFNQLKINNKKFTEVIDRVSTITMDKFRVIKLNITQDYIECNALGQIQNEANEIIELKGKFGNYNGDNITIGFNPKYLLDIFRVLENDYSIIKLKDALSAVLINEDSEKCDASYVVMPMKV